MIRELDKMSVSERQDILQHVIAPRPIALVSTIDKNNNPNLAPFSFFNLFSTDPPIVIFSPCRRVRDGSTKHSYENICEVPEAVIHIVDQDILHQANLASADFDRGVDEFTKAGFTPEKATRVRPPIVRESPAKLECRIIEIKPLGTRGGAGNLIIAEILVVHISEKILNASGKIDQQKIRHVARLGGDWYCQISQENLFTLPKPAFPHAIGFDGLPEAIRKSPVLTGSELAKLAGVPEIPKAEALAESESYLFQLMDKRSLSFAQEVHRHASSLIAEEKIAEAWQILLLIHPNNRNEQKYF